MHNVLRKKCRTTPKFVGPNFFKGAILERFHVDLKQSDGSPANPGEVASIVRFITRGSGEQSDRIDSVLLAQTLVGGTFSFVGRGNGRVLWFKARDARASIFGISFRPLVDDRDSPLRFFQAYVKWDNCRRPSFVNMAGLRKVEAVNTQVEKKYPSKPKSAFSEPCPALAMA